MRTVIQMIPVLQEILDNEYVVYNGKKSYLNSYAIDCLEVAMNDELNQNNEVVQCTGCGYIISRVLSETNGCPNCGNMKFKTF